MQTTKPQQSLPLWLRLEYLWVKKTHLAEVNTWLGFVIHPNIPQVQMISTKHILVLEVLELLIQNTVMTTKAIEKALGRLQWATAVCPMTKSLLQPFWAWKMAVTSSGRPPKTVRLLALLLKELFTIPYRQLSPYLPKSSWWGCSDASADSTGEAYIGDGCQMLSHLPVTQSTGFILKYPQKCFLGHSRMETPRRELQHWSCWAPWYSPTVFCKSRARLPLQ